jgi:hypothetical protein
MCKNDVKQPDGLISVLLNREAAFGDRHDAAMDLSEFAGKDVEAALQQIIADRTEHADLVEECEQSLQAIRRHQK